MARPPTPLRAALSPPVAPPPPPIRAAGGTAAVPRCMRTCTQARVLTGAWRHRAGSQQATTPAQLGLVPPLCGDQSGRCTRTRCHALASWKSSDRSAWHRWHHPRQPRRQPPTPIRRLTPPRSSSSSIPTASRCHTRSQASARCCSHRAAPPGCVPRFGTGRRSTWAQVSRLLRPE
jgi:hypothetical protein